MTQQEEEYLRSLASPQQPGEVDLPGRVQAVIDRLGNIDGLEKKAVMLEMQANGQNPLPSYLGLGQGQSQVAPPASPMAGWADATEQGGLGLASRQMEPQAMNRPTLADALAAQTFPGVDLSYFQKNRLVNAALEPEMLAKRASLAQTIQAQEETARQHDLQLFEKAMASPRASIMMKALAENPNYRMAKQAGQFHRAMKEQDYGSLNAYKQFIPEEVQEQFIKGELPDHEFTSWLDQARLDAKESAKEKAKAEIVKRAMNKDPEQRSAYETQLVEERQAALELKKTEDGLKKAQTLKALREAEGGDVKFTQMAQEIAFERYDKPYDQLTPEQKTEVGKEKERRLQGRTATMIQQGLPAPLKEQADIYTVAGLENLELEQAPRGLSEHQYRTGPYRQLDEKEKDALVQYKVAVKTVDTMNAVADKLITATTPAAALKQKIALELGASTGKNGLAAAYKKDRDAFSSRMARLVEVGVLTNTDVSRWADTFGSFGDTKQTLKAKQALFGEIQEETDRLMKLRLGGKTITKKERSRLDQILNKADAYRSADADFDILMGGAK